MHRCFENHTHHANELILLPVYIWGGQYLRGAYLLVNSAGIFKAYFSSIKACSSKLVWLITGIPPKSDCTWQKLMCLNQRICRCMCKIP